MEKEIDIVCIGEVLIDCIGQELNKSIADTTSFTRFLGGSPTNLAMNAAKLGLNVELIASCGADGLGDFAVKSLLKENVGTKGLMQLANASTSIILVSKSSGTPDFIPYRSSDFIIEPIQIPNGVLQSAKIFHTTSFALSKNPAQITILESAAIAAKYGARTSIDFNFSERIWPDLIEAKKVVANYLRTNPLFKLSTDDSFRFFGESKSDSYVFDYFHQLGASTICYTKGKEGVVLSDKFQGKIHQKALPVSEIKDATGAGDAFWTGFLYAYLHEKTLEESLLIAQKLAALKLQHVGGLPNDFDVFSI